MIALTIPLVIGRYLALRFGYSSLRARVLGSVPDEWLVDTQIFFWIMLGLVGTWFALRYIERYQTQMIGELLVKQLREDLFHTQLKTAPDAFAIRTAGKYLLRYSGDLKQIQNFFNLGVMAFIRDLLILIPAAIIFATILPELALPCLVAFALMMLPLMFLNRLLYKASVKRRDRRSGLLAFVSERLYRHSVIQVLNREKPEIGKFNRRSDRLTDAGRKYFRIEGFIQTLIPALIYLIPGMLFLWLEWNPVEASNLEPEALSLGALLMLAIAPIFRRMARVTVRWELGKLSMRKFLIVLNLPAAEEVGKPDLELVEGVLSISGLTQVVNDGRQSEGNSGRDRKNTRDELSEFGEEENVTTAQLGPTGLSWIRGKTGAGKTQLVRMLLQVGPQSSDQAMVDGQDLSLYNQRSVRKQFAVVSQAWPLLGKTVFEAISYSRREGKRKAAENMLAKVQAGVIPEQRLRLDDEIGDQGNKLSGGQSTLLLMARAFLTRKPILILDEPFLHLDDANRTAVIRRLKRLRNKRNIIVLSTEAPLPELEPNQVWTLDQERLPLSEELSSGADQAEESGETLIRKLGS